MEPIRPDFYLSITEGALSRAYYEGEEIKCDDYYSDDNLTLITYEKENLSAEQEPKRTGNWLDVDKKYLCFKFLISDIWHIGWIQIGFPNEDNKLVIYKYAYSNVPGLCVD